MRNFRSIAVLFLTLAATGHAWSQQPSAGEQALGKASQANQFTFILFFRGQDARTDAMHRSLTAQAEKRTDVLVTSIAVSDNNESRLIERFDAKRLPLPAVVAIAPNNAVTGVFPQRFSQAEFNSAIVSPGYANCVKALQDDQLVLLCIHPAGTQATPTGVAEFQNHVTFGKRTQVVNISASDAAEAGTLSDLSVRADISSPTVIFMAPPGVMVGKFDDRVTASALAAKLAKAGQCCDDPNCNHGRSASKQPRARR